MTTTKVIIAIVIAAAAVVAGGLVVARRQTRPKTETTAGTTLPSVKTEQTAATGLTGSLVVLSAGGKLERVNLADSSRGEIITDEKIRIAKVAPGGQQLFTLSAANASTGNLNLLDPASAKSTKLAELSLSGLPPVVSPDGKRYLSASFSNFEVEFGWHVYLNTVATSEKKEVFATPESLTNVSFSPDGDKIAFAVSRGKGGSELTAVNLSGGKQEVTYKTEGEILSLGWGGSSIFLIEAPAGKLKANQAELYSIAESGKDKKQLTTNQTAENFVAASADGKLISFLELNYSSGNVTPNTVGTVTVLDAASQKTLQLGEAIQVAGFLK